MVNGLACLESTMLETGLAASFGTRLTERTMGCGAVNHSLLLISCATQMQAADIFYSLLGPAAR
jgi:hypothetical protein